MSVHFIINQWYPTAHTDARPRLRTKCNEMSKRILVASPVRQSPAILTEFLRGLSEIHTDALELEFLFVDDNRSDESSELLRQFQARHPKTTIHRETHEDEYRCDETTHYWTEELVWKVASFKNRILAEGLKRNFDFVFLVDADLIIPPQLVTHLAGLDRPVVSEVFWTSWQPDTPTLPQVWLSDYYTLFRRRRGESLTEEQMVVRLRDFLKQLRRPGVYRVGGLGACTLIARDALAKGVSFSEIDNLSMSGEDRHFCVRARALGVELWADTRYPPLHLYREADLSRVALYRQRFEADFLAHPKLTLSMVVRNEADRWLSRALRQHRPFIQEAVIVDDASTDDTVDVVRRELEGIPLRLVRNTTSRFANEITLRKQQWEETLASNPDWVLVLDADEILEPRAVVAIPELIQQTDYGVFGFELYDFWDATHYRDDQWWCAHRSPRPFLLRYNPDFFYIWQETPQHCGRMPANVLELNSATVDLRVKHMGWADPRERARKYARYQALDPEARFGVKEQYESVLHSSPNLVEWRE
jgi:glycosyltransferase involved in cell wall biosynthesis